MHIAMRARPQDLIDRFVQIASDTVVNPHAKEFDVVGFFTNFLQDNPLLRDYFGYDKESNNYVQIQDCGRYKRPLISCGQNNVFIGESKLFSDSDIQGSLIVTTDDSNSQSHVDTREEAISKKIRYSGVGCAKVYSSVVIDSEIGDDTKIELSRVINGARVIGGDKSIVEHHSTIDNSLVVGSHIFDYSVVGRSVVEYSSLNCDVIVDKASIHGAQLKDDTIVYLGTIRDSIVTSSTIKDKDTVVEGGATVYKSTVENGAKVRGKNTSIINDSTIKDEGTVVEGGATVSKSTVENGAMVRGENTSIINDSTIKDEGTVVEGGATVSKSTVENGAKVTSGSKVERDSKIRGENTVISNESNIGKSEIINSNISVSAFNQSFVENSEIYKRRLGQCAFYGVNEESNALLADKCKYVVKDVKYPKKEAVIAYAQDVSAKRDSAQEIIPPQEFLRTYQEGPAQQNGVSRNPIRDNGLNLIQTGNTQQNTSSEPQSQNSGLRPFEGTIPGNNGSVPTGLSPRSQQQDNMHGQTPQNKGRG